MLYLCQLSSLRAAHYCGERQKEFGLAASFLVGSQLKEPSHFQGGGASLDSAQAGSPQLDSEESMQLSASLVCLLIGLLCPPLCVYFFFLPATFLFRTLNNTAAHLEKLNLALSLRPAVDLVHGLKPSWPLFIASCIDIHLSAAFCS